MAGGSKNCRRRTKLQKNSWLQTKVLILKQPVITRSWFIKACCMWCIIGTQIPSYIPRMQNKNSKDLYGGDFHALQVTLYSCDPSGFPLYHDYLRRIYLRASLSQSLPFHFPYTLISVSKPKRSHHKILELLQISGISLSKLQRSHQKMSELCNPGSLLLA